MMRLLARMLVFCLLVPMLPAAQAEPAREWTILAYMCGSDLESGDGEASIDIQEMLATGVGASEAAEVLIATGGASKWKRYGISSEQVQYYRLGSDAPELLYEAGDVSMGSPDTLSDFLRWGIARAPARRTMLILWDHGSGPVYGMCYDENHGDDTLTLDELRQALESGLNGTKLDLLAFSACLMNSVDIFATLADHAAYILASQETVTGYGLDYDNWLSSCAQEPGLSTLDLARSIARTYASDSGSRRWIESATMAVVDCAAVPAVVDATERFSRGLGLLLAEAPEEVLRLRRGLKSFGEYVGEDPSDLVDVAAVCDAYAALLPEETAALRRATAAAVVCNETTEDLSSASCGMSIFLPCVTAKSDRSAILEQYGGQSGDYAALVTAMTSAFAGEASHSFASIWSGLFGENGASEVSAPEKTETVENDPAASPFPPPASIWNGLYGEDPAPSPGNAGQAGNDGTMNDPAAPASPTNSPSAAQSPASSSIWAGLEADVPQAAATPAPQQTRRPVNIWKGLIDAEHV